MRRQNYKLLKRFITFALNFNVLFLSIAISANDSDFITQITINKAAGKTHSFISPDKYERVSAHLVEGPEGLILVDTGFGGVLSQKIKQYAKTLNKKIVAVLITHSHPDHTTGMPDYRGKNIMSTSGVVKDIYSGIFPIPSNAIKDLTVIQSGEHKIAGLIVRVKEFKKNESSISVIYDFPELSVSSVGDLVFNNVYAFPGVDRQNWITILTKLRKDTDNETLLPGHGYPTTIGSLTTMINYLKHFEVLLKSSNNDKELVEKLKKYYPNYLGGESVLSLQKYAFPKQ